jgi:hypothetical protein
MNISDDMSSGKAHILRLPDELLVEIVNKAALRNTVTTRFECTDCLGGCDPEAKEWRYACQELFDISLVDRRFNLIAIPRLYSSLCIECMGPAGDTKVRTHLRHTFWQNPSLQKYC